jgi:hypothetical protein
MRYVDPKYRGYCFVNSNRWLNGIRTDPQSIRDYVATMSNTKLKKMMYALVNRRDKIEKKNDPTKFTFTYNISPGGTPGVEVDDELSLVNRSLVIVTDEIAHRKLGQMLDTESTDDGKKE